MGSIVCFCSAFVTFQGETFEDGLPRKFIEVPFKKKLSQRPAPSVPEDFVPRGSPARPAPCARLDHDAAH